MQFPTQVSTAPPQNDGEVNRYESPELKLKTWFDRKRCIIFVNGMDNSGPEHRESAEALSTLQACPVVGVFNKSQGKLADLGQCLRDKVTLGKSGMAPSLDYLLWETTCNLAYQAAKKANPLLIRSEFVACLIEGNLATLALYRLLRMPEAKGLPIFAHSQGNLITSNALTAVALADGKSAIQGRVVNSFGSPCRFWPPGINRTNSLFTFDPVGCLDYGFDLSSVKVGGAVHHAFEAYMRQDCEFVINRFRVGGWGVSVSLDEEGLANAIVDMGVNPGRVYAVFDKLNQSYWADRDDVALYYVEKMKANNQQAMRTLVQAKPALADLLVQCLVGGVVGWDTKAEKAAAEWVASLKS